jgi:Zn-dependent metalloprotease
MSYISQTVTESNSFTVKDVIYDIGSNGVKTAAHVRLERFYQGIQVLGGDSVVHINATDMSLIGISQSVESQISIDASYISEINAQADKLGHGLVIYDDAGAPALAWDVIKTGIASDGTPMVVHYVNDVKTGKTIFQYSDTKTLLSTGWPRIPLKNEREVHRNSNDFAALSLKETVTCSSSEAAVGTGFTEYSGKVNLYTSLSNGAYQLKDTRRFCHFTANYCGNPSANISSPDYLDDDSYNYYFGRDPCNGTLSENYENIWGDATSSNVDTADADAHFGHAASFDYFFSSFGRKGIYNNGKGVYSRVHAGNNYSNAYWYNGIMTYGDGDGVEVRPLTALEIAGHELTHGITEATANLIYSGESGGLNEATSDIMGTLIDFYTTDRPLYNPNYIVGEIIFFQPGRFIRSMIQPSDDNFDYYGDTYGSFDCFCYVDFTIVDVHYSSGIGNHFFYLLAEGTTNGSPSRTCNVGDCRKATGSGTLIGIGKEKAGNIWYRALTVYFTPLTNYFMARLATIQAAKDLYTDVEVEAVDKAWAAVNVYSDP